MTEEKNLWQSRQGEGAGREGAFLLTHASVPLDSSLQTWVGRESWGAAEDGALPQQ